MVLEEKIILRGLSVNQAMTKQRRCFFFLINFYKIFKCLWENQLIGTYIETIADTLHRRIKNSILDSIMIFSRLNRCERNKGQNHKFTAVALKRA